MWRNITTPSVIKQSSKVPWVHRFSSVVCQRETEIRFYIWDSAVRKSLSAHKVLILSPNLLNLVHLVCWLIRLTLPNVNHLHSMVKKVTAQHFQSMPTQCHVGRHHDRVSPASRHVPASPSLTIITSAKESVSSGALTQKSRTFSLHEFLIRSIKSFA